MQKLGNLLAFPGAVALLAAPTILLANLTQDGALLGNVVLGGWTPLQYLWFYSAGFLILSHEGLQRRIIQARWVFLALALFQLAVPLVQGGQPNKHPDVLVWPCLLAILGFALRRLTFRTPFLDYANEAVLPFYILHQNALLLIGFFVVSWGIPDFARYLVIALSSLGSSLALYEFVIRRLPLVRLAFGLKPMKTGTSTPARRRALGEA